MKCIRWSIRAIPAAAVLVFVAALVILLIGRLERTVTSSGEVHVERYQIVRPAVSGLVAEVLVHPGQRVRKGDLLARLEDDELRREFLSARQALEESKSQLSKAVSEKTLLESSIHPLETARRDGEISRSHLEAQVAASRVRQAEIDLRAAEVLFDQAKNLADLGLLSQQELNTSRQARLSSEEALHRIRLESRLAQAQNTALARERQLLLEEHRRTISALSSQIRELEAKSSHWTAQMARIGELRARHSLTASLDGVIVSAPNNEILGRHLPAGEEVLTVIDPASIFFVAHVPEQALVRVRSGQPAQVEIAGLPKRRFDTFRGDVLAVGHEAELVTSRTQALYQVQIQLHDPWVSLDEGRFYLIGGMQGTAKIAYHSNVSVLRAVYEALVMKHRSAPTTNEGQASGIQNTSPDSLSSLR